MIITIDGPASAGKGTLASTLAGIYHLAYFDTGMVYRAVGLEMILSGYEIDNAEAAENFAKNLTFPRMIELAIDPEKAARYRAESKPEKEDTCTMCGEMCPMKNLKNMIATANRGKPEVHHALSCVTGVLQKLPKRECVVKIDCPRLTKHTELHCHYPCNPSQISNMFPVSYSPYIPQFFH